MMTKLSKDFRAIVSSNNNLQRYLESLLEGKDFTPRSWLYETVDDPDQILLNWKATLRSLENGTEFSRNVFQFDTSQEEKWGPQGGVKPIKDLMDSIVLEGFRDPAVPPAFKTDEWAEAKQLVIAQLKHHHIQSLRPASYRHVVDDMRARDTLESNSGWPLFTRRNKPEVVKQSIEEAENGLWKTYPAIALFRNYNGKTRLVWMFPMSANLVEGSFFQPLQSAIMNSDLAHGFFAPWTGFDEVRRVVTDAYDRNACIAASDFSSTDAHFGLHTSLQVYDVIKTCFQRAYWDALKESIVWMHTIPLVVSPTSMITGYHGVSSGSNWTNFIETVFDWILSEYVNLLTNGNAKGLYGIGDDMSWELASYDAEFADSLAKIGESVGQVIKAEKTTNYPGKVKSLQRLFQKGYRRPDSPELRGVYSTVRALKSSVFPERFHDSRKWSKDMFCARQFMILENCVDHPLFEEFVKFVCAGNRHLVPFAQKSSAELDKITRETKLLPGFNPTYNQERRDHSLATFASIQIARSL